MYIAQAGLHDLEELTILFESYRSFYKKKPDPVAAKLFLAERIKGRESVLFKCTNDENKIIGFVQLYPLFSSTRMQKLWLLNDLFVHEDFRGKGVSIALIDTCKELCKNTNACGLLLETGKDNLHANALYRKTGFQLVNDTNFYNWDHEKN